MKWVIIFMNELTKKQIKELRKLLNELTEEAKKVVKDYEVNPPVSGSDAIIVQVHEDSPILNEKNKDK